MTWTYDTNTLDATFSQNSWGRPTTATWGDVGCTGVNGNQFTQMYSYTSGGLMKGKRLRITHGPPPYQGYPWTTYDMDAAYVYDTEGHVLSVTYPTTRTSINPVTTQPGLTYTYTYDTMGRQYSLVDNEPTPYHFVNTATYGPADEEQQLNGTITRTYNSLLQITSDGTRGYIYSPTQNNGRAVQATEASILLTYAYDSLNRLASSSSSAGWGETFTYDGFGNLTDKTVTAGAAPPLHVTVNPANNRISTSGYTYDATGNLAAITGQFSASYDVQNRIAKYMPASGGTEYYSYGPDNMRLWKQTPSGNESITFYGALGERIGTYSLSTANQAVLVFPGATNVYFAGRLLAADRLGSTVKTYPYGEEYTTSAQDRDKFATYYRDGTSVLDYARNRYYSSTLGRFMSADPYRNSAGPADPGSWNRYAYAGGDPVNRFDPGGLCDQDPNYSVTVCGTSDPLGFMDSEYSLQYWYKNDPGMFNRLTVQTGGGGGRRTQPNRITNLSTTSKQAIAVQNDLRWLQQAIAQDPDCAKWLVGSSSAINYMLDVPGTGATMMAVGAGTFSTNDNAVAGITGTNLPKGMLITVNLSGAFFNPGSSSFVGYGIPSWIRGGTNAAQAEILLHEIAHDVGAAGFQPDGELPDGSPNANAQTANNQSVMKDCGNVVNLAAGRN